MITRFHNGSWWAYSSEFDSDTGPYSTEEQAQNFIDRADHWFEAGRLLAARVDELEGAIYPIGKLGYDQTPRQLGMSVKALRRIKALEGEGK